MTLNFRSVADAAWTYLIGNLDKVDQKACPHTCIAKEAGYEKRKIIMKKYPPIPLHGELPTLADNYDIIVYKPDVCYVCKKEMN